MEEKDDILSDWKLRKKPEVPNGFFDQFWVDLMNRIDAESGFLGQLKKAERAEVPEGFFDSMLSSFNPEETAFSLDDLQKSESPEIPTGYFENFQAELMDSIAENESGSASKSRIIPLRILAAVTSIAAAIAIIFSVVDFTSDSKELDTTVAEEPAEEIYDTYLTYLDEDEIIDYIIDNDIEIEDSTNQIQDEDYYDYSEADIEEYYLELL